jgi:hypothetical protein
MRNLIEGKGKAVVSCKAKGRRRKKVAMLRERKDGRRYEL